MKKLNKIAASVLIFSVLNINTYSALAQENKYNTNGEVPLESYIKEYKSDRLVLNNGEQVIMKDNFIITTDSDGNNEYRIDQVKNGSIKISNLKNGSIEYVKINSEEIVETKEEIQKEDSLIASNSNQIQNQLQRSAEVPPKGSVDGYTYDRTIKNSVEATVAEASVIIGVLMGGYAWASGATVKASLKNVLTPIASAYVSSKIKKLYWKERYYSKRGKNSVLYTKVQYNYYKYYDYTKYLGTVTEYRTCQPYGCNAPIYKKA